MVILTVVIVPMGVEKEKKEEKWMSGIRTQEDTRISPEYINRIWWLHSIILNKMYEQALNEENKWEAIDVSRQD